MSVKLTIKDSTLRNQTERKKEKRKKLDKVEIKSKANKGKATIKIWVEISETAIEKNQRNKILLFKNYQ